MIRDVRLHIFECNNYIIIIIIVVVCISSYHRFFDFNKKKHLSLKKT